MGVYGSRNADLDSGIWPLVPNSLPWELPEEMPLPGLVSLQMDFSHCLRESNNRRAFKIANANKQPLSQGD